MTIISGNLHKSLNSCNEERGEEEREGRKGGRREGRKRERREGEGDQEIGG